MRTQDPKALAREALKALEEKHAAEVERAIVGDEYATKAVGQFIIRACDQLFEEICARQDKDDDLNGLIEIGQQLWRARWQLGIHQSRVGLVPEDEDDDEETTS